MWKPMHRLPFPGAYARKRNRYVDEDSDDEDEETAFKAGRLHGYDASALHGWSLEDDEVREYIPFLIYWNSFIGIHLYLIMYVVPVMPT